jgi:hypothetical protein
LIDKDKKKAFDDLGMEDINEPITFKPKVPPKGSYLNDLPTPSTSDALDLTKTYQLFWESYEKIVGKSDKQKLNENDIERDVVVY